MVSFRSCVASFLRRPWYFERRLLRFIAARYSIRLPHSDIPPYAAGEDARAPYGILNRSGMIALAFEFMAGNIMKGDYFEFGCWGGRTFRMAFEHHKTHFEKRVHFWLFDSFRGLPELSPIDRHPKWKTGDMCTPIDEFIRMVDRAGIPKNSYTIIPGYYDETLTDALAVEISSSTKAGIVYIDCDLYESTRKALCFIYPFLQAGTIICFDDFYCFNGNPARGEQLAMKEFLQNYKNVEFVEYVNFGWHGKSFIVHIKD